MIPVVGVGAGGHAKVVMEILRSSREYEVVALLDSNSRLWGRTVSGVPVLGGDERLPGFLQQGINHAFIGVGSIGESSPRRRLYEQVLAQGFSVVAALHPHAVISPSAQLGPGATVMAGAVINAEARLGEDVIVNSGAIVEHDCVIGAHVHIATGARLASMVTVGEGSHVGLGASVRQRITIGRDVVVGAGAVVVDDVPDNVTVAGVPARILRTREV